MLVAVNEVDPRMLKATPKGQHLLRYSTWDAVLVVLAIGHGVLLLSVPVLPVIAIGVWWNSNTISHNFIHKPFFGSRTLNWLFALYLTLLLGIPQSIWKARHLAHHADVPWRSQLTRQIAVELFLVGTLWSTLAVLQPVFFLTVYLPGYVVGLLLCHLHGYYEHVRGTTSHYGWSYNWLFFNDGYHVEHHASPGTHWSRLPSRTSADARISRWPAVFRWLENLSLNSMERIVLRSAGLQEFVIRCHEQAFRKLLPQLKDVRRIVIVGGGLFPRTAIVLQRLLPDARLTVIDASAENLQVAGSFLDGSVQRIHGFYNPDRHEGFDLVIIPLAFIGDRAEFYRSPVAPLILVHDWLWRPRGETVVVSVCLLKRLNLIQPHPLAAENLAEHPLRLCRY